MLYIWSHNAAPPLHWGISVWEMAASIPHFVVSNYGDQPICMGNGYNHPHLIVPLYWGPDISNLVI